MDAPVLPASLYTVKAIAILDNDGERIIAKYYDETFPTAKEQKAFEKNLFSKTHRANAEIIMLEGLTSVYRSNVDLYFYVIGSSQENELILVSVLNCLYDSISQILRKNVEKRALLDHLDAAFLAVDEIVDGGIILESDYNNVVQRISVRGDDIPINEQTVAQNLAYKPPAYKPQETLYRQNQVNVSAAAYSPQITTISSKLQVLQSAREQLKWSLLK